MQKRYRKSSIPQYWLRLIVTFSYNHFIEGECEEERSDEAGDKDLRGINE